ncbi:hypothetical protein [Helicobacter pylori]|uniref:hypothetical protein n=1 Tax=Helicobacter pylori TaxID=210 RepID=UPI000EAD1507|nr:hypothetical protein [Helicobacter pylori]
MRQKNETATSFNQLKEITQIMQAQKRSAQTSENTHASDNTQKLALKPKDSVKAKGVLNPTKRAFSERQITTIRDKSQESANASQEIKQGNQQANHANAFKSDEKNTRGQE